MQTAGAVLVYTLHSQMDPSHQRDVFQVPPPGVLKIVLATNIAESSITIPDVVYVVDSGLQKQRQFDSETRTAALELVAISKQSMVQRQGRAGRVAPGMSISLYSSYDVSTYLPQVSVPAIRRVPLTELCLLIKQLPPLLLEEKEHRGGAQQQQQCGEEEEQQQQQQPPQPQNLCSSENLCSSVFALAMDAPTPAAVAAAVFELRRIGALDAFERLTPLGRLIARLPVAPRTSKMLVLAALLGCTKPAATLAACLNSRSPFVVAALPDRNRALEAKQELGGAHMSDHCVLLGAYEKWSGFLRQQEMHAMGSDEDALHAFCETYFLSHGALCTIRKVRRQLLDEMHQMGLPTTSALANRHAGNRALLKAICAACLLPNLLQFKEGGKAPANQKETAADLPAIKRKNKFCNREDCTVSMHPRSVVGYVGREEWGKEEEDMEDRKGSGKGKEPAAGGAAKSHAFACYENRVQTSGTFMDVASAVTAEALVLFADDAAPWRPIFMNRRNRVGVMICRWAAVVVESAAVTPLLRLRQALRAMLAVRVLGHRQEPPAEVLALMDCVAKVLWDADPASKFETADEAAAEAEAEADGLVKGGPSGVADGRAAGGDAAAGAAPAAPVAHQARLLGMVPSVLMKK